MNNIIMQILAFDKEGMVSVHVDRDISLRLLDELCPDKESVIAFMENVIFNMANQLAPLNPDKELSQDKQQKITSLLCAMYAAYYRLNPPSSNHEILHVTAMLEEDHYNFTFKGWLSPQTFH